MLCEFMQGSFVVVLELLFLVPIYFLLVGFIYAEFWLVHWCSVGCCEGRAFTGWRSERVGQFALCLESNFTFESLKTCFIYSKCGAFCEDLILVAFETFDILFWHLWGEKFDILCKADHPSFATCMYMRRRAVSILQR